MIREIRNDNVKIDERNEEQEAQERGQMQEVLSTPNDH